MKFTYGIALALIVTIVTLIFILQPKTVVNHDNFMKDGYQNMYIDHENDNIIKEIKRDCGADRVAMILYHNGSRTITGIPFIKESIKSEITSGNRHKSTHNNILINDNFYLNDYLYKNIYIYIEKVNYDNKEIPEQIIDSLLSNGVQSYYARHIYHNETIAGYIVVEKTTGFMSFGNYSLQSIEKNIKKIEKNISQMKKEEIEVFSQELEKSKLYIFVLLIIFVILVLARQIYTKLREISISTTETILTADKKRSDQLDLIGASLRKNLIDNHTFIKEQFVTFAGKMNNLDDRIKTLEKNE